MGELRKRGTIWWIRYYRNGKRHEESSRSTKKGVAERLLKQREGAVASGEPIGAKIGQLRFDEAADDLLTNQRVNGHRAVGHVERRITLHLRPWFTRWRMANLTTPNVQAYVQHRQEDGAANATINRELAALKRMFTLAVQAGKLIHRPYIPMLAEDNVRQGFFERDAFESVRSHLPEELQGVVTFAYVTGWRVPSEVLTLQWHQVDMELGTVRLEPGTTKNRRGRTFVFADLTDLRLALEAQRDRHEELRQRGTICPWVFHRNGTPIRDFRGAWKTACRLAGCPGRVPHDLRRSAVRNLERAGVPRHVAMQMTGHKTESVYRRYDIVSHDDLAAAGRRLNTAMVHGS